MNKHELDFISFLFNDEYITTMFNKNVIEFVANNENDFSIITVVYPGNMRKLLEILAALNIPDFTPLCNIPAAAKSALYYIK